MNSTGRWNRFGRCVVTAGLCLALGLSPAARAEESIASKLLTLVSKMPTEQQEALYNLLVTLNGAAPKAAATAPTAPSAEQALATAVKTIKDAAIKGDLDAVMNLVADDFQQSQLGGKDALRSFFKMMIDSGEVARYAKETEITTANAKISANDGKASIDPVEVSGSWGSAALSFTAKLVGNEWKITGAELR